MSLVKRDLRYLETRKYCKLHKTQLYAENLRTTVEFAFK